MCNKIHIYFTDEWSLKWLVINYFISTRYKNRFILEDWRSTNNNYQITIKLFSGERMMMGIPKNDTLKIIRKIKLDHLQQKENLTTDKKEKLNKLRFKYIEDIYEKNKDTRHGFTTHLHTSIETQKRYSKRQRLARENKGNNKSKNR